MQFIKIFSTFSSNSYLRVLKIKKKYRENDENQPDRELLHRIKSKVPGCIREKEQHDESSFHSLSPRS